MPLNRDAVAQTVQKHIDMLRQGRKTDLSDKEKRAIREEHERLAQRVDNRQK